MTVATKKNKKRINIAMDEDTLATCDELAASLGLSRSSYISFLVNTVNNVVTTSSVTVDSVVDELAAKSTLKAE